MKFAVPLGNDMELYKYNPCTAPKFAIYTTDGEASNISFVRLRVTENPWLKVKCEGFEGNQIDCACSHDRQKNLRHITEHYAILDAIGGCHFLLANHYCKNTLRTLRNGGVKIYEIPKIVTGIDNAIKNFLVGAYIARSIKHIQHDA